MNILLWTTTAGLLLLSFIKSKEKTLSALKKASKQLGNIMVLFLIVMAGFALFVTYVPSELIQNYIGTESGLNGIILSLGIGSISVMPGFAAFPLCAALKSQGIPYYIIAAFSVTLMNVGFITFPIEKKFLGLSVALLRNFIALLISIVVTLIVKTVFGE